MDLATLNTKSITKYSCGKFNCSCGKSHSFITEDIYFELSAMNKLSEAALKFAPALSMVCLVIDKKVKEIIGRNVEKTLSKNGFRVVSLCLNLGKLPNLSSADEIQFPEDTKLIIGVGAGAIADLVKYRAAAFNLPCIILFTSAQALGVFTASAMLFDKGIEETFKVNPPKAVLLDQSLLFSAPSENTAAAFGGLVSKLTSLFDWKFSSVLTGESYCDSISEQALSLVDEIINRAYAGGDKNEIKAAFAELNLKFSALTQLGGNSRMNSGSESQCSHALKILYNYEEREQKLSGENEFLFARILIKLYKNFLKKQDAFFVPPPDNNRRLEKISEFFGLLEADIIRKQRSIVPSSKIKLFIYKMNEYRDELYNLACDYEIRLEKAWKIFKRLYDDDGFSLVGYMDKSEVSIVIAAAADLKEKYTLLAFMKDSGYLDKYLEDALI